MSQVAQNRGLRKEYSSVEFTVQDMASLLRGDIESYRRLAAVCYEIAYAATHQRDGAEELSQEVMLKVLQNKDKYDSQKARPCAWLATIARNTYRDWYRREKSEKRRLESIWQAERKTNRTIEETIETRDETERDLKYLKGRVGALPTDQRTAIKEHYFGELTYKEFAEKYGIPEGTAKSRIHDGVAKLRKAFESRKRRSLRREEAARALRLRAL